MTDPRIIVAMDFPDASSAMVLTEKLDPSLCRLKIGKELFVRTGPAFVEQVQSLGFSVFLDLKFHDIPHTVAAACRAAADLGVWMLNVHALGGTSMMSAAMEALQSFRTRPLLTAVTLLTSMDRSDLEALGINSQPGDFVRRLAGLVKDAGLDGVVCSAHEAGRIRAEYGNEFILVTPGIRPAGTDAGDQKRIMTPEQAIRAGASYLVVGRPVTRADEPLQVLGDIARTLQLANNA